jgi:hypothetical protein
MRLDPELLDGSPETGARVLALARLADADEALSRLLDPKDREGGRVLPEAVARLAAVLRALAPALGGVVPSALLADLDAGSRAAGPLRDAEALAGWLVGARGDLAAPYRGALDWLADRVDRRARRAREELVLEAGPRLRRALPRLQAALGGRRAAARSGPPATFAAFLAGALRAETVALREAAGGAAGPGDAAGLELVRAGARRLHDLLAPARGADPTAEAAGQALDALRGPLEAALAAAAARGAVEGALLEARAEEVRRGEPLPGLRPGLLALLRVAEQREAAAQRELAEPLRARLTAVTDAAYAAVGALEGAPEEEAAEEAEAAPPMAPERRFLVTAIPPEGLGGDVESLQQGWLPGDGRESVGVTRSPLGEQWFRARAPARGRPGRVEPVERGEFETLWPLTEGRRISKRRHLVTAAPGWHFDEYVDRPLVLAVAEEGNGEAPPPWLEPVLVRDVSGERGYLDEALARRPARRSA